MIENVCTFKDLHATTINGSHEFLGNEPGNNPVMTVISTELERRWNSYINDNRTV